METSAPEGASRPRAASGGKARLTSDLAWTLAGIGLPPLAAVVAVPILIERIGVHRFGILSLSWVVVGYFSLFDLGLGRAMTHRIARHVARAQHALVAQTVWNGTAVMLGFSVLGSAILFIATPLLVRRLSLPPGLVDEAQVTFNVLSASLPIIILAAGFRGVLEGLQRFDLSNLVRVPTGLLAVLAPLAAVVFTNHLGVLVGSIVLARLLALVGYVLFCIRIEPEIAHRQAVERRDIIDLLSFGGWLTVSNVATPLLSYLGHIMLGVRVSAEAVTYYATPFDVVVNLLIVTTALVTVYFPRFAQEAAAPVHSGSARSLFLQAAAINLVCILPATLVVYLFADRLLALWINPDFARVSAPVARLIAVGVFINSFAHVAHALLQAHGRPDLTAKLHICELFFFIPVLWVLIGQYGGWGAALAWLVRVTASTTAMGILAYMCLNDRLATARRGAVP